MLLRALRNSLANQYFQPMVFTHILGLWSIEEVRAVSRSTKSWVLRSVTSEYACLSILLKEHSKNNISRPVGVETTSAFKRHTYAAIQSLFLTELVTDLPGSLLAGQTMKYVHLCTEKKRKKIHNYNRHAFYSLFTFVTVNRGSLPDSTKKL